ncbi:23S rRNA (uracil(1939)-C(5))-methyltransferase RlmD [Oceanidesulfovibrio marinus]|uniref:23S rRNA (Uracil(1939)-C(5))-methyltransferase RlmD n=1 Tax=Oceanidesulfovibrio marinus TaxID=370038 RepID=A0A6P1ZL09_9BACT|nr:23S rRNA (uracil(1939)-C(5))-methyltransferase RlmD [Oceanidesulfovibrio marinus]TVM36631.1 23S rRNA (uracil(1939)-C(5))-methyltransferase RlmD [Oceanidesulfovibrio marinus]
MSDVQQTETAVLSQGSQVELTVEKLANGGQGLGHVEGMVVFVDRGLPGQRVRAVVQRRKKRHAEAHTVDLLSEPDHPAEPFCAHFGACGGCLWQDLDLNAQRDWKRRFVQESYAKIAGLEGIDVEECVPSPESMYYRNKMEFAFGNHPKEGLGLGLYRRGSHEVLSITECHLQTPRTAEIVGFVRDHCRKGSIPAWEAETKRGYWRFCNLRVNERGEFQINIITADDKKKSGAVRVLAEALLKAFPDVVSVIHSTRRHKAAIALGEHVVAEYGAPKLPMQLGPLELEVSPNGFFQTNTQAALLLYDVVAGMAGLTGRELVWDVFCGSGSLGLAIASGPDEAPARWLVGFEISRESVRDARSNAERLERSPDWTMPAEGAEFRAGDVRKMLGKEHELADLVVVDPPRAGLPREIAEALAESGPERIVYVSCNPATQARDLGLMQEYYRVERAVPVDMFPHTPHVECAALLMRR